MRPLILGSFLMQELMDRPLRLQFSTKTIEDSKNGKEEEATYEEPQEEASSEEPQEKGSLEEPQE